MLRLAAALGLLLLAVLAAPAQAQDRYALANGCYSLKAPNGKLVAKTADGGYRAGAGAGEAFRLQATGLGSYLLYGTARDFLAVGAPDVAGLPLPATPRAQSEASPTPDADWRVDGGGTFTLTLPARDRALGLDGDRLVPVPPAQAARFAFVPAGGCAVYPEPEVGVEGAPSKGATSYGEVSGLVDAHMHMMAFEFLGGRIHCGYPWHRFGAQVALVDCPDHEPYGAGAAGENLVSYGNPVGYHDTRGWPTLKDWPHHDSLTHEQSYYKWVERTYRSGLRIFVNLLVDNEVLCTLYPYKDHGCNEMDGVRLQAQRIRELQDYIDAQSGGPGKGWFRIVTSPWEARRVANEGKLAVVLGIEVSKLFDCGVQNDEATCDRAQIDRQLDEVHELGVRDMELVNKFDNGLAGVAGDEGTTGLAVNAGNRVATGHFWRMGACTDQHSHDKTQPTDPTAAGRDALAGNLLDTLLPPGTLPLYGPGPHCNSIGLSPEGEYLVRRMMAKGMIIDPDHLSVRARQQLLDIVESESYSGIVSSHSWSSPDAIPRIYRLGGMVTPMAGAAHEFVAQWKDVKAQRDPRFYYGIGWGADMNGFAHQGAPRNGQDPVTYPFKSFDGRQTIGKQVSGQRVYDVNVDGMAHYGLLPDWLEDARRVAGEEIVRDLGRGAEAYLQMWERAEGVPPTRCQAAKARAGKRGLGLLRVGASSRSLLRRAGQPRTRGRAWTWCVTEGGRAAAVLTPAGRVTTVVSTARRHRALKTHPGAKARRTGRAIRWRRAGGGRRVAIGVRKGTVRWVAVTSARSRKALRRDLARAELR